MKKFSLILVLSCLLSGLSAHVAGPFSGTKDKRPPGIELVSKTNVVKADVTVFVVEFNQGADTIYFSATEKIAPCDTVKMNYANKEKLSLYDRSCVVRCSRPFSFMYSYAGHKKSHIYLWNSQIKQCLQDSTWLS